jgi:hypothetical protein
MEAVGEWIQFLDADNELLPQKIDNQMALTHSAAVDIIIGNRVKIQTFNGQTEEWIDKAVTTDPWIGLITSKLNSTSANLWRKAALQKVGGYTETWETSEDYELIFKLLKENANVVFCPFAETIVHMRQNSLSRSTDTNRRCVVLGNALRLRVEIRAYLKKEGRLTRRYQEAIDRYILERLKNIEQLDPVFAQQERKAIGFQVAASAVFLHRTRGFVKRFLFS